MAARLTEDGKHLCNRMFSRYALKDRRRPRSVSVSPSSEWPGSEALGWFALIPKRDIMAERKIIFTALRGMQTQSSDENSVCPSVRTSHA